MSVRRGGVMSRVRRALAGLLGLLVAAGVLSLVSAPAAHAEGDWPGVGFKVVPHQLEPTVTLTDETFSGHIRHTCVYQLLALIPKSEASPPSDSSGSPYSNATKYSTVWEWRNTQRTRSEYLRANSGDYISGGWLDNQGAGDDKNRSYGDQVAMRVYQDLAQWNESTQGYQIDDDECAIAEEDFEKAQEQWSAANSHFLRSPRFDATCTVTQSGPGGSELSFDSVADVENDGYTQQWTFSDGTTSTANGVLRTATTPGAFTGTFKIANSSRSDSAVCTADVKAPELGLSVDIVDDEGEPIPIDEPPTVDDTIHVRVRVSAGSDGVGSLKALRPVEEWITSSGGVEPVGEPVLPEGPFDLAPGAHRDVLFDYQVIQAGPIGFGTAVQGTDAIGRMVQKSAETRDSVAGIGVDVQVSFPTPPGGADEPAEFDADNNGDGQVDALDSVVTVTVTATNLLEEDLTEVHLKDAEEPVDFVNRLVGEDDAAAALEKIPGETYDADFGELGPGDEADRTYKFQALKEIDADANVFLRGNTAGGSTVPGFGTARAVLSSHLALEVRMVTEDRPVTSGQVVRLHGRLKNLLEDKTLADGTVKKASPLAVLVIPVTDGNAGGGFVSTTQGGRTPVDSDPVVLQPGETVVIGAILPTQRSGIASHAKVDYLVRAWEPSEVPGEAGDEIDSSRIKFVEDDTSSASHDVILGVDPLEPDDAEECETTQLDAIVSCNLWVGLRDVATSTYEVVTSGLATGADAYERVILWEAEMLGNTVAAVYGDEEAKRRLITEMRVQLDAFVAAGIMAKDALGAPGNIEAVGNAFTGFMNQTQDVFARGDYETIIKYTAQAVGSNPDVALAPLLKVRMMRAMRSAAIADREAASAYARTVEIARDANVKAAREAQDGLLARVEEAAATGQNVAESGVFKGSEDVTDLPQIYSGVAGAREVDVRSFLQIAKDEGILIAFRSRSPLSQQLIDDALAWLKPMDVKAKTVSVLDTTYLGYRESALGKVELTSPPIDFALAAPGREAEFTAAVDAYMDKLKGKFPELANSAELADEVRARLVLRTTEFPKELANFARYGRDGIKIEFGYGEQGLPRSLDRGVADIRAAEVTPGLTTDVFGETRSYFELKMAGPNGGALKWITGDIDIVAILNADRTLITDVAKRLRIYDSLRELLGMQHGDTITWINPEKQAELLREHVPKPDGSTKGVDPLFVAGPDERLRIGFLQERLSSKSTLFGSQERPTFHLLTGAPRELISPPGGVKAVIDSYDTTWRKLQQASCCSPRARSTSSSTA